MPSPQGYIRASTCAVKGAVNEVCFRVMLAPWGMGQAMILTPGAEAKGPRPCVFIWNSRPWTEVNMTAAVPVTPGSGNNESFCLSSPRKASIHSVSKISTFQTGERMV
jgi:hypothetical protein